MVLLLLECYSFTALECYCFTGFTVLLFYWFYSVTGSTGFTVSLVPLLLQCYWFYSVTGFTVLLVLQCHWFHCFYRSTGSTAFSEVMVIPNV